MADVQDMFAQIYAIVGNEQTREAKAQRVVDAVQTAGRYRWVGLYDVSHREISILTWSGEQAPAHPRFPVTQGLGGAAVSSGRSVVVGDVRKDARYLSTFGSTRSEIVVPIHDPAGAVIGLIDVESDVVDAFSEGDRLTLEWCAGVLAPLFGRAAEESAHNDARAGDRLQSSLDRGGGPPGGALR